MSSRSVLAIFILCVASVAIAQSLPEGRLLRFPDVSKDKIAFSYGGDLWLVSREGGVAQRITSHPGQELFAKFSRRKVARLHRAIRRQPQCLHHARRGRRPQAVDLSSRRRPHQ